MTKINRQKNNGYALLELLFYISFFAVLSLVVIDAMVVMAKSFKETSIQAEFAQSGSIMERMSREVRQANSINSISATDLKLNTTDNSGVAKTIEFFLSGTNLQLIENGALTGNLNTPTTTISAISFTQITTLQGKAVKITLSVKSSNDKTNRTTDFYDTIVLRGSY